MASPFTFGNFDGWSTTGDSLSYAIGRADYPDYLSSSGEASVLSPVLTGEFAAGDLIVASGESYNGGWLTLECIDDSLNILAAVTVEPDEDNYIDATLAITADTTRVRVTLGGDNINILSLDVPGLIQVPRTGLLPSTNSIPSGWEAEAGDFDFSYSPSIDSGDGNGSVMAISSTGGQAGIKTHVFEAAGGRFYSLRERLGDEAEFPGVNSHWEAFDANDAQCGGGNITDPDVGGTWVTQGFTLPSATSYLKIFVHGAPGISIYLDAMDLPAAPGVGTSGAEVFAPVATIFCEGGPAGATASISPPRQVAAAFGGGFGRVGSPAGVVRSSSGAIATLAPQAPTLYAVAHDSTGEQAANLTAPSPALTITAGANAKLAAPKSSLTASGTVTTWGKAVLTTPAPALHAAGTVSGVAESAVSAPRPNLIGYGGAVVSVALTGRPTLQATGTNGAKAGAAVQVPLFALASSGSAQNYGSADLLAPSPRLGQTAQAWLMAPGARLTAIGTATITATYEAYSINLGHRNPEANDEVTRYTNFPFDRIVRYQGSYFGVGADGLYLLEGTTDDGQAIPYAVKTCIDDFKLTEKKTLASAYFGGRLGPDAKVTVYAGETGADSYDYSTPRGTGAQNHREKFGRGVKDRFFAIGLSGQGVLELDNIEPEINKLTRRV